jgi:hypothetical protein
MEGEHLVKHLDDPVDAHDLDCALWVSHDPLDACTCGADREAHDTRSPALPHLTTAQRLDRIQPEPVALACDDDTDEAAAS